MLRTVSFGYGVSQKMEVNSPLQTLSAGRKVGACSADVGLVSRQSRETLSMEWAGPITLFRS